MTKPLEIPVAPYAERIVTQAVCSNSLADDVIARLGSLDVIHDARLRAICTAARDLRLRGSLIDFEALRATLIGFGPENAVVVTEGLLADVLDTVGPEILNWEAHVAITREYWQRRAIIEAGLHARIAGHDLTRDIDAVIGSVERSIEQVRGGAHSIISAGESVRLAADAMQARYDRRNASGLSGIPSGLTAVDRITGGFMLGKQTVIGAYTSGGKTALLKSISLAAAVAGYAVTFFTYETPVEDILLSMACMSAEMPFSAVQMGRADLTDMARVRERLEYLAQLKLRVIWGGDHTTVDCRQDIRALKREYGPEMLVCADYLQVMPPEAPRLSRYERISQASHGWFKVTRDEKVATLLTSQFNRPTGDEKTIKRPTRFMLKESGEIENHANLILLIHRPEVDGHNVFAYDDDPPMPCKGLAEIIVAKNTAGPISPQKGEIVRFDAPTTRFLDYVPDDNAPLRLPDYEGSYGRYGRNGSDDAF